MLTIGSYTFDGRAVLAPMAGVTDHIFRAMCLSHGAAFAVGEMVTSNTRLWHTHKTQDRLVSSNSEPVQSIQIAGSDPAQMAQAASHACQHGAQIIDINMGCPAKKVCNKAAGSALLQDETLVERILQAVVNAVDVPVTLKFRTGWSKTHNNALNIAAIAEQSGIQALALHGRTRECRFKGQAEFDTIAAVKQSVSIPVIANGDITDAAKAESVLKHTRADAIMIGRGAQGNPWIFRDINNRLKQRPHQVVTLAQIHRTMTEHLLSLYTFYGEIKGPRIARKHIGWYLEHPILERFRDNVYLLRKTCNLTNEPEKQQHAIKLFFEQLYQLEDQAA